MIKCIVVGVGFYTRSYLDTGLVDEERLPAEHTTKLERNYLEKGRTVTALAVGELTNKHTRLASCWLTPRTTHYLDSILDLTWPRNERAVVKSRRADGVPDNAGIAHCPSIETSCNRLRTKAVKSHLRANSREKLNTSNDVLFDTLPTEPHVLSNISLVALCY